MRKRERSLSQTYFLSSRVKPSFFYRAFRVTMNIPFHLLSFDIEVAINRVHLILLYYEIDAKTVSKALLFETDHIYEC